MKRMLCVSVSLMALIALGVSLVAAQPQMGGQQERSSGQAPVMGGSMMGMPMMSMMCPMMPQMMAGQMDPWV